MVRIYTLTLAPSLDSATITPQIYPEGKLRCTAPVFEPGGGGINVARAIAHLGGTATAIFPAGGATGEHLVSLLAHENIMHLFYRTFQPLRYIINHLFFAVMT